MTESDSLRTLQPDQLEAFDIEHVTEELWERFCALVKRDFPSGVFSFADLGGGNGVFTDRVLDAFPGSSGVVLDNAESLLARNREHARKRVVHASIGDMASKLKGERFDLICFNWVLHHLVAGSSASTRKHQREALVNASSLLKPGGRISVFENFYQGWLFDALPGWTIYQLTSSKALAGFTRRMGANTAGVGVYFRSRQEWETEASNAQLSCLDVANCGEWYTSPLKKVCLHLGTVRQGHLWCANATP